jgi:hypothetical protein
MGLSGAIVKLIKDIVHIYEENYYLFLFSLTVVIRYIDKVRVYIISQNFYRVLVSAYISASTADKVTKKKHLNLIHGPVNALVER